jgi:NADH-quinone oxidoreductase subunit N
MSGFISYVNYSDFLLVLPETWLIFSILHCLLIIAKFNFQTQSNEATRKQKVTMVVLKWTLMHLQVVLLFISLLFLQVGLDTYRSASREVSSSLYNSHTEELLAYMTDIFSFNHHFLVDGYSLFFKFVLFLTAKILLQASTKYIQKHPKALIEFPILVQLVLFFLSILISANDLIVAFIAIIGFSLNIYVLILTDSFKHNSREAAMKYYYLSALSAGLIAFSIVLCYLLFVSTNLVDIQWLLHVWNFQQILPDSSSVQHLGLLSVLIFFLTFGVFFKLAAFPCHLWASDVYEGSPQPIMAFFILPIKLGVLIFIFKLFLFTFKDLYTLWSTIFWISSVYSMLFGALYALVEKHIRKFLAYSSINQMGFILSGIVCGSIQTTEAAMIFLMIYIITNLGLFIILLNTYNIQTNRQLLYLSDFHYFAKSNLLIYSIAIAIILFSMAGIPPLAGFFGKYFLFLTVFEQKYYSLVIIGLFTSVISTFYYLKIIKWLWFEHLKAHIKLYTELTKPMKFILVLIQFILVSYIFSVNDWLYSFIDGCFYSELSTLSLLLITSTKDNQNELPRWGLDELQNFARTERYKNHLYFGVSDSPLLNWLNNFTSYILIYPFIGLLWLIIRIFFTVTNLNNFLIFNISLFWVFSFFYILFVLFYIEYLQIFFLRYFVGTLARHYFWTYIRLYEIHIYWPLIPVLLSVILVPSVLGAKYNTAIWEYVLEFLGVSVCIYVIFYSFFFWQIIIPLTGFYDSAVSKKSMTTTLRWLFDEPFVKTWWKTIFKPLVEDVVVSSRKHWDNTPPEQQQKYIKGAVVFGVGTASIHLAHLSYLEHIKVTSNIQNEARISNAKIICENNVANARVEEIRARAEEIRARTENERRESAARVREASTRTAVLNPIPWKPYGYNSKLPWDDGKPK